MNKDVRGFVHNYFPNKVHETLRLGVKCYEHNMNLMENCSEVIEHVNRLNISIPSGFECISFMHSEGKNS